MSLRFFTIMKIPNLLLIAGTGNKSGKTTLACRIIEQFRDYGIFGIKITPHFHETTPGLNMVVSTRGYSIYEETDPETQKDTSRMLRSGAKRIYFVKVTDEDMRDALTEIMNIIPAGTPIVCESPALRYHVDPGLFIIMKSDNSNNKDINDLLCLPHVMIHLDILLKTNALPIQFHRGKWIYE